jgi:hypothetical protein
VAPIHLEPADDGKRQTQSDNIKEDIKASKGRGLTTKVQVEMATECPELADRTGREDLYLLRLSANTK